MVAHPTHALTLSLQGRIGVVERLHSLATATRSRHRIEARLNGAIDTAYTALASGNPRRLQAALASLDALTLDLCDE